MSSSHATLRSIFSASLLVFGSLALVSAPADATNLTWRTVLGKCYVIKLISFEADSGYSTYKYRVTEKTGCKDLSNWVLALPGCEVVSAHPKPWERVKNEPNTRLTGIKWETGAGFRSGIFVVKVKGEHDPAQTHVAAKGGPAVSFGKIAGPDCSYPE
jgi:hypothetical protein